MARLLLPPPPPPPPLPLLESSSSPPHAARIAGPSITAPVNAPARPRKSRRLTPSATGRLRSRDFMRPPLSVRRDLPRSARGQPEVAARHRAPIRPTLDPPAGGVAAVRRPPRAQLSQN